MEPIILNEFGESLEHGYADDYSIDLGRIGKNCLGTHGVCNGFVDILKVSQDHKILRCRVCGRIPGTYMTADVDTIGKMRLWLKEKIEESQKLQSEIRVSIARNRLMKG